MTSGGASYPHLEKGLTKLAELQEKYGQQIQILPGGGVRQHNAVEILQKTKCTQIHMTAKHLVLDPSTMHYPKGQNAAEYSYVATEEAQLSAIMAEIKNYHQ
ncbi:Copper homeostasis protein CutC [bioreactor metagenome]|uniref:Copper homeostasis protein cutC homolog n=1 Tax=bioreactor metagenome TaxID=1076179 RepID=A0A645BY09_9ZZZZ